MRSSRQGRFNSNYKGTTPTINILAAWEWEEIMKCPADQVRLLLEKYNRQYMAGTYPTRIDVDAMEKRVNEKRNEQADKSLE